MTQGFKEAGFVPVFAVDNNAWAVRSYRANFGLHAICSSVDDVLVFPRVDVVIGGPPCQGFSTLGRNNPDHPLNGLWRHYYEALVQAEPMVFVMENVPGLLRSNHFQDFRHLADKDYDIHAKVLNAADFGVPQTRKRAIVIGSRRGRGPEKAEMLFPEGEYADPLAVSFGKKPWVSVEEAFRQDEKIPADPTHGRYASWDKDQKKRGSRLHVGRRPTSVSILRYQAVPAGGNRKDLQEKLPDHTPPCWRNKISGGTDLMGRLWADRPATTIRTEFWKPEKGRYLHPTEHRAITHQEAARLQTFPDTFWFVGPKTEVARQIGNAVPVRLAEAIALRIHEALVGLTTHHQAVAV